MNNNSEKVQTKKDWRKKSEREAKSENELSKEKERCREEAAKGKSSETKLNPLSWRSSQFIYFATEHIFVLANI